MLKTEQLGKREKESEMSTGIKVNGGVVYATPKGLKVSTRGKVQEPGAVYGSLTKGEARQLRKSLHRMGYVGHASRPRN